MTRSIWLLALASAAALAQPQGAIPRAKLDSLSGAERVEYLTWLRAERPNPLRGAALTAGGGAALGLGLYQFFSGFAAYTNGTARPWESREGVVRGLGLVGMITSTTWLIVGVVLSTVGIIKWVRASAALEWFDAELEELDRRRVRPR